MIELSQTEELCNLITLIDYEKAFDNIKWSFLHKSLEAFGFGKYFRDWIKAMYSNTNSCVMNNGYSSAFFPLSKGIRQGCPISALLFIIVVEILAINIRGNTNIKGIMLNNNEVKISLLADDTTLFLKDIISLQTVINTMYMFKQSSGLKINKSKTQVLQIGRKEWNLKCFKLKSVKDEIYTLGTWFYKDPKQTNSVNYDKKFQEFEAVLQYWKHRNLTILERIKIVKVFALAKLNYTISSLEISQDMVSKIQNAIFSFIWDDKKPKIKNSVAIQDFEHGGLKIPWVENYVKANRATWAKRLLCPESRNRQYLEIFLPSLHLFHFLKCNYNPEDLPHDIPFFYLQILYAWFALKNEPQNALDIHREYFIFNRFISINNNYVFKHRLIENNILSIHNLLTDNGTFISYDIFCEKYGKQMTQFEYMSLIDAIPNDWKKTLKSQTVRLTTCNVNEPPYCKLGLKECNVHIVTSSEIYWYTMHKEKKTPTCINSWKERINVTENELYWKAVFTLPLRCLNDFKVKELQIKIIHRFYPCQSLVAKWDKSITDLCILCNEEQANIIHTFYECVCITDFWCKVKVWITNNMEPGYNFELNCETVLLGVILYTVRSHGINHCIMYCKHFIHLERIHECQPNFKKFLNFYKHVLNIEKEMYTTNNEKNIFNKSFGKMLKACTSPN